MWKRAFVGVPGGAASLRLQCLSGARYATTISSPVNSMIFRSLKDHYLEIAKMIMPPKVALPSLFTIVKGALDSPGPVLKRTYGNEEISIYVMRLGSDVEEENSGIDQLFLHVDVSKPG